MTAAPHCAGRLTVFIAAVRTGNVPAIRKSEVFGAVPAADNPYFWV